MHVLYGTGELRGALSSSPVSVSRWGLIRTFLVSSWCASPAQSDNPLRLFRGGVDRCRAVFRTRGRGRTGSRPRATEADAHPLQCRGVERGAIVVTCLHQARRVPCEVAGAHQGFYAELLVRDSGPERHHHAAVSRQVGGSCLTLQQTMTTMEPYRAYGCRVPSGSFCNGRAP